MDGKNLSLLVLITLVAVELIVIISNHIDLIETEIDIKNSTCFLSTHIGRKLFYHECTKDGGRVHDIRHFFNANSTHLTASFLGVQLSEKEFQKVCEQCSN